jgi:dUTPase
MIPIIYISQPLHKVLSTHNISPQDYKPAYNGESIGLDLYNAGPQIRLPPLTVFNKYLVPKILIPTGLHIALQPNTVGLIMERGSITKTTLTRRAGVIDPGYTDEIFVNMVNIAPAADGMDYIIDSGQKLPVQLIVVPAITQFNPTTKLNQYRALTRAAKRQHGQRGSSD